MFFFYINSGFNFFHKKLCLKIKTSFLVRCDSQKTVQQNETNHFPLFSMYQNFFLLMLYFLSSRKLKNTSIMFGTIFIYFIFQKSWFKRKTKIKNYKKSRKIIKNSKKQIFHRMTERLRNAPKLTNAGKQKQVFPKNYF